VADKYTSKNTDLNPAPVRILEETETNSAYLSIKDFVMRVTPRTSPG
jgi:hypothetical protein